MLIAALILLSAKLAAQDTLTFTWQIDDWGSEYIANFGIQATMNEEFTIDWGDGVFEIKSCETDVYYIHPEHEYEATGKYTVTIIANNVNCKFKAFDCELCSIQSLDVMGCSALTNLICNYNQIESLAVCPSLVSLICNGNQLTGLDLSNGNSLEALYIDNNRITSLDLTKCPVLKWLNCHKNRLPLLDLYSAHLLIDDPNNKRLGTQNLLQQAAVVGERLFSQQSVFVDIFTSYFVTKNGSPATESDYDIENGELIFNATGEYIVKMTNEAIISREGYPAEVIVPINVSPMNVSENDLVDIRVFPNPTKGRLSVDVGALKVGKIELFNSFGRQVYKTFETTFDISHLPSGAYFLKINESTIKIIKQ